MNNPFSYIPFAVAAIMVCSCSNELYNEGNESGDDNSAYTFTARQEGLANDGELFNASVATRTSLAEDKSINWALGDAVGIYDGASLSKYVVSAQSGTSCTFTATGTSATKSDSYESVYPYNMGVKFEDGKVAGLSLSANQEATDGGFDPSCNLMVANYDKTSSTLEFKNVCSYIKLKTTFDCSRIIVTFNGTDAKPTGTFDVAWDSEGNPVAENVNNTASDANVVRLLGDIKAGVDYYIAVLPGTYTGGLKVTLEPKNAATMIDWTNKLINFTPYYKATVNDVVLKRSYNKSFGTFDTSLQHEGTTSTEFEDLFGYATLYDNGNNYGSTGKIVLWAKKNVGAESETQYGSYFAWGEVVAKDTYTSDTYLCKDYYPRNLDQAHDAATVNYGQGWKIPSDEEFADLKENCIFVYDGDAKGYYVYPGEGEYKNFQLLSDGHVYRVPTGMDQKAVQYADDSEEATYVKSLTTTKEHIFLPLGGYKQGQKMNYEDTQGFYWTNGHGENELWSNGNEDLTAYYLGISLETNSKFNMKSYFKPRYYGFNIRPVFVYKW